MMPLVLDLETIGKIVAIATPICTAAGFALNHFYLRRSQFFAIRKKDEDKIEQAVQQLRAERTKLFTDHEERYSKLEGRFTELETQHRLLAEGPLKAVVEGLQQVRETLSNMDARAERRDEKLMETLTNLDRRVTTVEAHPAIKR